VSRGIRSSGAAGAAPSDVVALLGLIDELNEFVVCALKKFQERGGNCHTFGESEVPGPLVELPEKLGWEPEDW
jgi:hypothetical protein